MPLTPALMALMDDEHLVRAAQAELDPLTSTPLEAELLRRLDDLLNVRQVAESAETLIEKMGADGDEDFITNLCEILDEHGIAELSDLRAKLERADKFYNIASDAGDVISRINDLINTTL